MSDPVLLAERTTLRLGGRASRSVTARTSEELVAAVRRCDDAAEPVLLLGGGSNLVVADAGFAGTVVDVATAGVAVADDPAAGGDAVLVTVAAGEDWDAFVARAVAEGWVGIEALSGIPGSVGATPVQNVGAYGQEVADTVVEVRVYDRATRQVRTLPAAACGFAYRHSRFKADPGRSVVLSVTFRLARGDHGAPVAYAELARALGVDVGDRAPLGAVREAVLRLRRSKGMVLDEADHDTWSAGSFFTNPVLDPAAAEELPAEAPRFPTDGGGVKTSAAWLIDRSGFGQGYGLDRGQGRVSLSTKHVLALTNRGGATTAELVALAREVRDGVRATHGVTLVNEPFLVGCPLD